MIPLNYSKKTQKRFQIQRVAGKEKLQLNWIIKLIDWNIKIFAKNEKALETLIQQIIMYNQDKLIE